MGCGASSKQKHVATAGKCWEDPASDVGTSLTLSPLSARLKHMPHAQRHTLLDHPVWPAKQDLLLPVSGDTAMEDAQGTLLLVYGLADAAHAIKASNLVAAANFSVSAAAMAESIPVAATEDTFSGLDPMVAVGLAATALAAAEANSKTAEGLIDAAVGAAIESAQARTKYRGMS